MSTPPLRPLCAAVSRFGRYAVFMHNQSPWVYEMEPGGRCADGWAMCKPLAKATEVPDPWLRLRDVRACIADAADVIRSRHGLMVGGRPVIAALFVQSDGCYIGVDGVDPWPIERDARCYDGMDPVVAHPPCATWGRYAHKCGGIGNDGGTFLSALTDVRRCGGVIEHPATSLAWAVHSLPPVYGGMDAWGGWSFYVLQRWWGHAAIKPTLLYVCGAPYRTVPALPDSCPVDPPLRPLEHLSKRQRAATPPAFRDWLLRLADGCRK